MTDRMSDARLARLSYQFINKDDSHRAHELIAEINRARASEKRLEEVLKSVEWAGSYDGLCACVSCGEISPDHATDCALAAALKEVGT